MWVSRLVDYVYAPKSIVAVSDSTMYSPHRVRLTMLKTSNVKIIPNRGMSASFLNFSFVQQLNITFYLIVGRRVLKCDLSSILYPIDQTVYRIVIPISTPCFPPLLLYFSCSTSWIGAMHRTVHCSVYDGPTHRLQGYQEQDSGSRVGPVNTGATD